MAAIDINGMPPRMFACARQRQRQRQRQLARLGHGCCIRAAHDPTCVQVGPAARRLLRAINLRAFVTRERAPGLLLHVSHAQHSYNCMPSTRFLVHVMFGMQLYMCEAGHLRPPFFRPLSHRRDVVVVKQGVPVVPKIELAVVPPVQYHGHQTTHAPRTTHHVCPPQHALAIATHE